VSGAPVESPQATTPNTARAKKSVFTVREHNHAACERGSDPPD
jgi:hypothetical protein